MVVRIALPKGSLEAGVTALLADAGIRIRAGARSYRPELSLPGFEAKILKPQNVVEMLHAGSRDVGFAGLDWVSELDGQLVELLDTGLDPVRIVAAAPESILVGGELPDRPLVVASEYERLAQRWIERRRLRATFVRSYGATEVFPPEDADVVVDNSATGTTLRANGLAVVDELLTSSTRVYANPRALDDADRRATIERLVVLLRSVLEARRRVLLEVNVTSARLEAVLRALPAMRQPTVAPLAQDAGFAVKAAVPRDLLPRLILELKTCGATDLVVTTPSQIVP
jgi:ATP phosphoribosyltransferase